MKLTNRSIQGAVVAALSIASLGVAASPANAADLKCSSGSYNTRVAVTGACAWGNVTSSGSGLGYTANVNMVVVDNANDGHGAYLAYRTCSLVSVIWQCTNAVNIASTNGYNTSKPAQTKINFGGGTNGSRFELRVCDGSVACSGWDTALSTPS